jgi:hypothetical protein
MRPPRISAHFFARRSLSPSLPVGAFKHIVKKRYMIRQVAMRFAVHDEAALPAGLANLKYW